MSSSTLRAWHKPERGTSEHLTPALRQTVNASEFLYSDENSRAVTRALQPQQEVIVNLNLQVKSLNCQCTAPQSDAVLGRHAHSSQEIIHKFEPDNTRHKGISKPMEYTV